MSRSGYSDDLDYSEWQAIMYRGAVESARRGKRGQAFFKDLLAALDAMPEKRLVAEELETKDGQVCAIGALGKVRGVDMSKIDPEDPAQVSNAFNIAMSLVREIVYMNDEGTYRPETPEERFIRMRNWIAKQIKNEQTTPAAK
jgi:hypothetical protein